jgi:hypothetical protein
MIPPASSPAESLALADAALHEAAARDAESTARIARLEAQLAEARHPRVLTWQERLRASLRKLGVGFGWAAVYFSLLPTWWKGQTIGKKVFGLKIVELTGKPLTLVTSFGRYGGYAAGMATGGMGFVQVAWDPNRQAVQDKIAHTVVVDLRSPRRAKAAEAEG